MEPPKLFCSAINTHISQMTIAISTAVELMAIHLYLTRQLVNTTAQCSWGYGHPSLLNQAIRQHHCTEHLCLYTHTPVLMRVINALTIITYTQLAIKPLANYIYPIYLRLLTEAQKIVPSRFTLYVYPISLKLLTQAQRIEL